MRLTRYTDYAFRVLIYLGTRPGEFATIQEISDSYGISKNHLMKVVQALGRMGYVETARGKKGGIRLGRPATEIAAGDVARHVESDFELAECFAGTGTCRLSGCCTLSGALSEALEAFLAVLDSYSLADLLEPRRRIRRVLKL